MNTPKKKRIFIAFLILILLLSVYFIYKSIRGYNKKWKYIVQNYIADFNNDGKPEMLIIYNYHKKKSAMKLVDIKTGENIWKSSCRPSHIHESKRIVVTDSVFAIAYDDFVNSPHKYAGKSNMGVEAFNKKTGEKLWDSKTDSSRNYCLHFNLINLDNTVLFHTCKIEKGISYLTSISNRTGEKIWEVGFPMEFVYHPQKVDDSLAIINGTSAVFLLNFMTGDTANLFPNCSGYVFQNQANESYIINQSILYKYNDTLQPVIINEDTVRFDRDTSHYFDRFGLYENIIVAVSNDYNIEKSRIESFPINKEGKKYRFYIDNATFETASYYQILNKQPDISGFHLSKTRFVPLIKQRKIDEFTNAKQLTILDLEKGELIWQSSPVIFRGEDFYSNDILYSNGYYLISLNLRNRFSNATQLVLDGQTGKFTKAIHFEPDTLYSYHKYRNGYDIFYNNYFYGSTWEVAWSLKFPDMKLIFATDNRMKVVNDSSFVEEKLGIMPWLQKKSY